MKSYRQLMGAISKLESEGRRMLASAASAGQFDELSALTPVVKDISDLAARWKYEPDSTPNAEPSENMPALKLPNQSVNGGPTAPRKKTEYPRFLRERDDLVKLGWSPRE